MCATQAPWYNVSLGNLENGRENILNAGLQNFHRQKFYRLQQFLSPLLILIFSASSRQCCISSSPHSSVFSLSLSLSLSLASISNPPDLPFQDVRHCAGRPATMATPASGAPAVRWWRHAGSASAASSRHKLLRQRHSRCVDLAISGQ